jgi:hypothetical protein
MQYVVSYQIALQIIRSALAVNLWIFICLVPTSVVAQTVEFLNDRHAYIRGELITLKATVNTDADQAAFDINGWYLQHLPIRDGKVVYTVDTSRLRAGQYDVRVQLLRAGSPPGHLSIYPLTIAPEPNPQRFPIWHWHGATSADLRWWIERGFTGFTLPRTRDPLEPDSETARQFAEILDQATGLGVEIGAYLHPLNSDHWRTNESDRCLYPDGRRDAHAVYPRSPQVLDYARHIATEWMSHFAAYPSLRHIKLSSEYVTPFCTNEMVKQLAYNETGINLDTLLQLPNLSRLPYYTQASQLPTALQPQEGIILDTHPLYRFLKWWWERGHGTSTLNLTMAQIIKTERPDIQVWHDPYRLAPVYDSHRGLDIISTWTYGYPDIQRLLYTRVLQAAAKRERQKVMQTITLVVKGDLVQPSDALKDDHITDRAGHLPYLINSPDYARETIWLVFSLRPDVLSFFFSSRLMPDNPQLDPFHASPATSDAIGEVARQLIQPFGPAILQSQRERAQVAVLLSASALWFTQSPWSSGYINEQILPFCILLAMNHVPFDVLLEDDILDGRLDDYQLLVLPRGDTLTANVHRRLVDFAQQGRQVIADKSLQAHIPGVHRTHFDLAFDRNLGRPAGPDQTILTVSDYRQRMMQYAEQLQPLLSQVDKLAVTNSKQTTINALKSGDVHYLFVINHARTYGPRLGQARLIEEIGIRQTVQIRTKLPHGHIIYDAIARERIDYSWDHGEAVFQRTLPPARGRLLAVLPEPIDTVAITIPPHGTRGKRLPIVIRILNHRQEPIQGALPVQVEVVDPLGRQSEYSRYGATTPSATNAGLYEYTLPFFPAENDVPGKWTIRATELLSGRQTVMTLPLQ